MTIPSTIKILDRVEFRRTIQASQLELLSTTSSSITGGHDGPPEFRVEVNDVSLKAVIGHVHPAAFESTYVGAEVLIGVHVRKDYDSYESLIPYELLPENPDLDSFFVFTVVITDDTVENHRGYGYEITDSVLRDSTPAES